MQKHFTVECPECGHQMVIRVCVDLSRSMINDALQGLDLSCLDITAIQCNQVGETLHMTPLEEVPISAAPRYTECSSIRDVNVSVEVVQSDSDESEIDNVVAQIQSGGYVPNGHLFRRWIMAQDSHMESLPGGITAAIHAKGYEYMWKSSIHELDVTLKIRERDPENYVERIRFMHDKVFIAMSKDYIRQLRDYFSHLDVRHYQGQDYKRLPRQKQGVFAGVIHNGRDILVSRFESEIIAPLERLISKMERSSGSYRTFVDTIKEFNRKRIIIASFTQCREWIDAYKAIGAYYTLKNAFLFHNVYVTVDGNQLTGTAALEYLRTKAEEYSHPDENGHEQGYKLYGLKREIMEYNAFDFDDRMRTLGIR